MLGDVCTVCTGDPTLLGLVSKQLWSGGSVYELILGHCCDTSSKTTRCPLSLPKSLPKWPLYQVQHLLVLQLLLEMVADVYSHRETPRQTL